MNASTENTPLINQFAATAHAIIDQLQENATSIEELAASKSAESGEEVLNQIQSGTTSLEKTIKENPMMAAAIAFAFGACATRFFKSTEATPDEGKKEAVTKAA